MGQDFWLKISIIINYILYFLPWVECSLTTCKWGITLCNWKLQSHYPGRYIQYTYTRPCEQDCKHSWWWCQTYKIKPTDVHTHLYCTQNWDLTLNTGLSTWLPGTLKFTCCQIFNFSLIQFTQIWAMNIRTKAESIWLIVFSQNGECQVGGINMGCNSCP